MYLTTIMFLKNQDWGFSPKQKKFCLWTKASALTYELLFTSSLQIPDLLNQPRFWSLCGEDSLEKGMATHASELLCGCKESDTTEQLTHTHTHTHKHCWWQNFYSPGHSLTLPDPKSSKVTKSLNTTFKLKQYKLVFLFVCLL